MMKDYLYFLTPIRNTELEVWIYSESKWIGIQDFMTKYFVESLRFFDRSLDKVFLTFLEKDE